MKKCDINIRNLQGVIDCSKLSYQIQFNNNTPVLVWYGKSVALFHRMLKHAQKMHIRRYIKN